MRRVRLSGTQYGIFATEAIIPTPMVQAQYYHLPLDIEKLIKIRWAHKEPNESIQEMITKYTLPADPAMAGLRPMTYHDIEAVCLLLNQYLDNFSLHMDFSPQQVEHVFLPEGEVVRSYVVQDSTGITDFCSFYDVKYHIGSCREFNEMKIAQAFYTVPGKYSLKELFYAM